MSEDHPIAADSYIAELTDERERLLQRIEKLEEFFAAHEAVDQGLVDFDLHNEAVDRLDRARDAITQEEERK